MFFMGLGVLIAVPAFKAITHLPPFLGVLLGLGLLWLVGDFLHRNKTADERRELAQGGLNKNSFTLIALHQPHLVTQHRQCHASHFGLPAITSG